MSNSDLLNIDPSILEKKLLLTDQKDSSELESLFPKEDVKSKLVKPSPGFCIKIRTNDGQKTFINICQTESIPAPEDISESALMSILQSEARSNYRVPMSIGYGRTISDNAGNPATAYDVAIHPAFLSKIEKSQTFKEFFVTLVFEALEDKYNISLNRDDFCLLRHKKSMGKLQLHRIQQREINTTMNIKPPALIEEIPEGSNEFTEAIQQHKKHSIPEPTSITPKFRFIRDPPEGDIKNVIGQIKFPGWVSSSDLELDVGEDRVLLTERKLVTDKYKSTCILDKFLPFTFDQDKVTAKFSKNNSVLELILPVIDSSKKS